MPVSDREFFEALLGAEARRVSDLREADQRAVELLAKYNAARASNVVAYGVAVVTALAAIIAVVWHH
jgi:hypothetical protein